jgi:FAD/FMN-containing dehydrogenase
VVLLPALLRRPVPCPENPALADRFLPWRCRRRVSIDSLEQYELKKQRVVSQLHHAAGTVCLNKKDSNLFRNRDQKKYTRLDVRNLNQVITIDTEKQLARVEGMAPFDAVVDATLSRGFMPCVVPELKSITVGGAISGVGIESSSFKYGFVHESVEEMDILLSDGSLVTCTKTNEHKDLFFGIPNSYGTFGYILSATIRLVPVKPFVKLTHKRFAKVEDFFAAITTGVNGQHDFIDGVVFSENELYLTLGEFVDSAPYTSNYTYMKIYYKSIQKRKTDYLSIHNYIWRWDTDWFWCSQVFGVQNPILRFLTGKWTLHSRFYLKLGRINKKLDILSTIKKLFNIRTESIIQDVEIPIEHAAEYLQFQLREIPVRPVWVCPMKSTALPFDLYKTRPESLYINFGFWQVIKTVKENGYYNKLIENKVEDLKGKKTLYSESYYSEDTFWKLYNRDSYFKLKEKYDTKGMFENLYQKCVLKR